MMTSLINKLKEINLFKRNNNLKDNGLT